MWQRLLRRRWPKLRSLTFASLPQRSTPPDWHQDNLLQPVIEILDYYQNLYDHLDKYLYCRLIQETSFGALPLVILTQLPKMSSSTRAKIPRSLTMSYTMHAIKPVKVHINIDALLDILNVVHILVSLIDFTPAIVFLEFFQSSSSVRMRQ
ncbi:hypothetical protein COEREDRAFT_83463 [Coemansia reversa NRRL 1564]|uniref:Uncharacterized protein n=1 Tax=Coemansia reversa (strain ATCC 12441 / NRRL 1564) TaxID=763665 RepID=A0A2G5B333_COERN|nr:hypothetical protein COEREDRAFT_83463 [Coemansia reversa NRRL 1564]|eukprot:PIA13439.1 hypothetical protein COEREDRAFT_83463 [Coemansia reversa NRRL 1564]